MLINSGIRATAADCRLLLMIGRTLSTTTRTQLARAVSLSARAVSLSAPQVSGAGVNVRRTLGGNVKSRQHAVEMRRRPKTCRYMTQYDVLAFCEYVDK